jgi:hydroxymethylglutaryl-CoA reductase (NADPH)
MSEKSVKYHSIPRDKENDYTETMAQLRPDFVNQQSQQSDQSHQPTKHINQYSFNPTETAGNIENFIGVAQVPIGLAGPVLIDGEHAQGPFYVPMAH